MILRFFFLFYHSQCYLNIYPFVQNGRTIRDIGNTRFALYDSNNSIETDTYDFIYGDDSNPDKNTSFTTNHLFDFPGKYTVMATKFSKNSIVKSYVQKMISVEHVQEFYTFVVMGPFEKITDDSQVTEDLLNVNNSEFKYSSLQYNSLPISPNTSYWKLQIAYQENPSDDLTKNYIESGLEPKITVTNSSIQITVLKLIENMWVLKISANEVEPISIAAKFEIYSSNLLLNPAGSDIYFSTRVFWSDLYDPRNEALPNVSVKISPVSISQNSGVYVYNGSIFMTDDSYTTFHRLKFSEIEDDIDEAVFCTICFACTSKNRIFYRNYFVNDTLTLIPNHPDNIEELHIYSVDSDDIPRETIASDVYDIAGPFFASYRNQDGTFSILRFNGETQIIDLKDFENITEIIYVTPISNINWVYVVANEHNNERGNMSIVIRIDFRESVTNKFTRFESYNGLLDDNEVIIGAYLQPCTEELITYTNKSVFVSFDSGRSHFFVGNIVNGVASITSRHSADEIYILDNEGNFYIIFGERLIMHLFESYKFQGLSLAINSADTLYLLTDENSLDGYRAIPVDSYIQCFAIDYTFENDFNFSLSINQSSDGISYTFREKPNSINYFDYLSLFSLSGIEECKFGENTVCRRLFNGEVFSPFTEEEIDEFIINDDDKSSIKFKNKYLTQNDINKTLFILDILGIFQIVGSDEDDEVFYLNKTTNNFITGTNLNQSNATCQIIDLRSYYYTIINVDVSTKEYGYEITTNDNSSDFQFNENMVGQIIQFNGAKAVIYKFSDTNSVIAKPIDEIQNGNGSFDATIRSPFEEENFIIEPSRSAPWHLGFSLCGGNVESIGTSSFHQNLPVLRLIENEELIYEMSIPSENGKVQTRFSQPNIVLSTTSISNHQFIYSMMLNSSTVTGSSSSSASSSGNSEVYNSISSMFSIPFSRVVSLYMDGSPRCTSLSIIGVSPLCPPYQRLVVTLDDDLAMLELPVNYRPPSVEGNQIGLSKNVYNRDPENKEILKSKLKKSRQEFAPVPNRCKNANNTSACHCERAELEKMNEEDTDCLKFAYLHDFSSTFSPRVNLQSYVKGEWVVTNPEPEVLLTEVNGRNKICVNGKCTKKGTDELSFKSGDEIQLKGIELWHLKFRTAGSCSISCYYMMYVNRPPLMQNMVYLIQGIVAVALGLIVWIAAYFKITKDKKDRKMKQETTRSSKSINVETTQTKS